jgi:hypothetical protein
MEILLQTLTLVLLLQQEKFQQEKDINEIPVSVRTMHELVRKHLLHHGYGDTLHAFEKAKQPEDAQERALYDSLDNRKRTVDTRYRSIFFTEPWFHELLTYYYN